jgi:UDP-galactopyranose mutase
LSEEQVAEFFERVREKREVLLTSEDIVLDRVGKDLCEKFFRGYTRKQWGIDLSQLSAAVAARIPVRVNSDDRYFTDQFQAMPLNGYTKMFECMLDSPCIQVELGVDFFEVRPTLRAKHVIYTGPIDEYFTFCLGKLPYRSLRFEHEHLNDIEVFQPVGTVNYPNNFSFTRITEFKHLTGQKTSGTSIVREYPQDEGDPYYPVPRPENDLLYKQYQALADSEANTTFLGRLARYQYFNMDQIAAAALKCADELLAAQKDKLHLHVTG